MKTLFLTAMMLVCVGPTRGFLGAGDVVIVAANPAQEALWAANELPKWIEMINKAQEQVNRAREMVDIVGHPEQFAARILENAAPALAVTRDAAKLKTEAEVLQLTRATWTLYKSADRLRDDVLRVDERYRIFGKEAKRDPQRYLKLAMEKALRVRLKEALQFKSRVDKEELALQSAALKELSAATSQSEIALHDTALTASRQRMEFAAARVKQAEVELATFMGDVELDQRREREQAREWAEKTVDAALQAVLPGSEVGLEADLSAPIPSARDWNPFGPVHD